MRNRLIDWLCAIAGVRPDARRRAPHARAQAAMLGLLLLLTASVSAFTSGFAIACIDVVRFSMPNPAARVH